MNNRKTLAALILQGIAILLLFIPAMFVRNHWMYESSIVFHGRATLQYTQSLSFANVVIIVGGIFWLLGIIVFMLLVCNWALTAIQYFSNNEKNFDKIQKILYPVQTIAFLAFVIVAISFIEDSYSWRMDMDEDYLVYIEGALLVALTVIAFIKNGQKGPIADALNSKKEERTSPAGNIAEELEQLKDLLDKGIITQEEFDAKKKQLLRL